MTIDEAIVHAKEKAKEQTSKYDKCPTRLRYNCDMCFHKPKCNEIADKHEQLAEWLEELKAYRTLDKTKFSDGYNKAIDDFAARLCYKIKSEIDDCSDELDWIDNIAALLKAGGENENT